MSSSLLPLAFTITPFSSPNTQSRAFRTRTNKTHGFRVSCNNAQDEHKNNQVILPEAHKFVLPNVDRRNLLMGLGGIYTTANLASIPDAISESIKAPEITLEGKCKTVTTGFESEVKTRPTQCCPPSLEKDIQDFKFPTEKSVRIRWPAHKGTTKQVNDYIRAIKAMRALPDDDPHSFVSQAKIHCAYCHGAYSQAGKEIQIHNSWLFFPFHRWYLYFYERILGKLIDEPEFALPFWKWDEPAGMPIPDMFLPKDIDGKPNPLYDEYRDSSHLPPHIVDLSWTPGPGKSVKKLSKEKKEACNLTTVYRELVRTESDPLAFFGGRYGAGDDPINFGDKTIGAVEAGSHTAIHLWVGDSEQPNNEDMGRFYSAGYDPLFYCHHANVDRMWKLWNNLSPRNVEPADDDWKDASYVFYDENKKLVRVYNRDSVNLKNLKYNFDEDTMVVSPWRTYRPEKRNKATQVDAKGDEVLAVDKLPLTLNKILKFRLERPENTENAKEVLVITGIQFDCNKFVKFDVFVNDKVSEGGVIPTGCDPEYAGCFAQIPHSDGNKESMRSGCRFGLTELYEDTNTQNQEFAVVALVPRAGCDDLTIGKISIEKLAPAF